MKHSPHQGADYLKSAEIDVMTRRIIENAYLEHTVIMIAVGIYSVNPGNNETGKIYEKIRSIAMLQEGVLQIHGFFVDEDKKMSFQNI